MGPPSSTEARFIDSFLFALLGASKLAAFLLIVAAVTRSRWWRVGVGAFLGILYGMQALFLGEFQIIAWEEIGPAIVRVSILTACHALLGASLPLGDVLAGSSKGFARLGSCMLISTGAFFLYGFFIGHPTPSEAMKVTGGCLVASLPFLGAWMFAPPPVQSARS